LIPWHPFEDALKDQKDFSLGPHPWHPALSRAELFQHQKPWQFSSGHPGLVLVAVESSAASGFKFFCSSEGYVSK